MNQMETLKQVYCKQDEEFTHHYYEDDKCTIPFNFEGVEEVYIHLTEGNITPLYDLQNQIWARDLRITIYTPLWNSEAVPYAPTCTLDVLRLNETLNYSKYIPKESTIVFLDEGDENCNKDSFRNRETRNLEFMGFCSSKEEVLSYLKHKKLILFRDKITSENIQEINETAKELKEEYGIEEIGVFSPECYIDNPPPAWAILNKNGYFGVEGSNGRMKNADFDQLITTDATGILEPEESDYLKVISCKEIFQDYLNNY